MCSLELLVVALLACCVGITLGTPTPTDIHIGGIFNVWNKDKSLITQGQEALAAFLLAIKEINNKTDGIYDNMLQGYRLTPAIGRDATDYVGAVQEAFDMDALTLSPVAIVSSLTDITAVAATNVLETVEAVHLITHATTAELSKGVDYPNYPRARRRLYNANSRSQGDGGPCLCAAHRPADNGVAVGQRQEVGPVSRGLEHLWPLSKRLR